MAPPGPERSEGWARNPWSSGRRCARPRHTQGRGERVFAPPVELEVAVFPYPHAYQQSLAVCPLDKFTPLLIVEAYSPIRRALGRRRLLDRVRCPSDEKSM